MLGRGLAVLTAGLLVAGCWVPVTAAAQVVERVVASGEPVPGAGGSFTKFQGFELIATGEVIFRADLRDDAGAAAVGVYGARPGSAREFVRTGQLVSGRRLLGLVSELQFYDANAQGNVVVPGSFEPNAPNSTAVVANFGAGNRILAAPGDRLPGGPEWGFRGSGQAAISDDGQVAFIDQLGLEEGLFLFDGARIQRVATSMSFENPTNPICRLGFGGDGSSRNLGEVLFSERVGTRSGGSCEARSARLQRYTPASGPRIVLDSPGRRIVWYETAATGETAYVRTGGIDALSPSGWVLRRENVPEPVARTVLPTPLGSPPFFTERFASADLGPHGRVVALCAEEADLDPVVPPREAIHANYEPGGALVPVAKVGEAAVGEEVWRRLCLFRRDLVATGGNAVAFRAIAGFEPSVIEDRVGIFLARFGEPVETLMREGDDEPVLGKVVNVKMVGSNRNGQVAWHAAFDGGAEALYRYTPPALQPIPIQLHDEFELLPCWCPGDGFCFCEGPPRGCALCDPAPRWNVVDPLILPRQACAGGAELCSERLPFRWDGEAEVLRLGLRAHPDLWFGVVDEDGTVLAQSHPSVLLRAVSEAKSVERELRVEGLEAGRYALVTSGPAGPYQIRFGGFEAERVVDSPLAGVPRWVVFTIGLLVGLVLLWLVRLARAARV